MSLYIIGFCLCVIAVLIYLRAEHNMYKTCFDYMKLSKARDESLQKKNKELEASLDGLRSTIMKYRTDIDEYQEHCARLREGQQKIVRNQKTLERQNELIRAAKKVEITFIERNDNGQVPSDRRRDKKVPQGKSAESQRN